MAGGTLSEVYQQARHLLLRVRDGLEKLERLESHSSSSLPSSSGASGRSYDDSGTPDLAQNLKHDLSQLQTYSVEMDRLWRSQVPVSQRDLWKRKLEQVAEEVDSLKLGLDKYLSRRQRRQMEAKERAELLHRVTIFRNPTQIKSYAIPNPERCNVPASAISASADLVVIVDTNLPGAHIALHRWQPNTPDGHGMPFLFQHGKAATSSSGGSFMRMFKGSGIEDWHYPRCIALPATGIRSSSIVAITSDMHIITGGHADNTVKLILAENAKTLESAAGHCAPVTCLAISPDGSTLVTGSRDATAILWRLHRSSDKLSYGRLEPSVLSPAAAVSSSNSGSTSANINMYGRKRYIEGPLHVLRGHIGELNCCCINADLDLVVSGSHLGGVLLHSISRGRLIRRLPIERVDIVSLSAEGMIIIWDKSSQQLRTFTLNGISVARRILSPFPGDITCIEISKDGKHALFGTSAYPFSDEKVSMSREGRDIDSTPQCSFETVDGNEEARTSIVSLPSICLLDLHTLKIVHVLELNQGQDVTALTLNKDNTNLVVSLRSKQLLVYTDPMLSVKVVDQMLRLGWQGEGLTPLITK